MLLRSKCFGAFVVLAVAAAVSPAQTWRMTGVYRSTDEGKTWERLSPEHHEDLRNSTEGIFTLESGARSADSIGTSMMMPSSDAQKPR